MIREVTRDDIPVCVDIIRKSFKTVAEEFGFTIDNAPRFTAFATTEERLYWQMDNEPRLMFVRLLWDGGYIAFLSDVIVDPKYQGQGIGHKLVEASMLYFDDRGAFESLSEAEIIKCWRICHEKGNPDNR